MDNNYIPRTLWYTKVGADSQDEKVELGEAHLLQETRPLIVLGEAGMGKTELMKRLGQQPGYSYCTAKKLMQRDAKSIYQDGSTLVIDALDEAASKNEGDAISKVLEKLEQLGFPRFVLSCRVAEWHSRSYTSTIKDGDYEQSPLEVHLQPFSKAEILSFLGHRLGVPRAAEVHTHFEQLGLVDWLGNPQTLDLICAVASKTTLPQTRAELFKMATKELAKEHNGVKKPPLPIAKLVSASGAACAALLLCGKQSIVRKPHADLEEDELLLQDLEQLPNGSDIASTLNTRLFMAHGADQFGYMHRRIGEYLAAQWLAQQADTDRKRRRLLALFQHLGMVPASLRGLYAWLARDAHLAQQVIAFDPIAVIEYGETDDLPAYQARLLLQTLARATAANPRQGSLHSLKVRCFAQADLQVDVAHWITLKDPAMIWLRVLVIESLEGSAMVKVLHQSLASIAIDANDIYAARSAALRSLANQLSISESRTLVAQLAALANEDALRLALDFAHHQDFENFEASVLADICLAYAVVDSRMAGKFYFLKNELPESHLLQFLDVFTAGIPQLKGDDDYGILDDVNEMAFALIAKAVRAQPPSAQQVLQWLSALDRYHLSTHENNPLNAALADTPQLRKSIQHTLLITQSTPETLRSNWYQLAHYLPALNLAEPDLIELLDALPAHDGRWKELVLLAQHDDQQGAAIRHKAQKFAAGNPSEQAWLMQLTAPRPKADWEIEQEKRKAQRQAENAAAKKQSIAWYTEHLDALKAGDWEACWRPASIYVRGIYGDSSEKAPPEERLPAVLNESLALAAYEGFENHLLQPMTSPTLDEIAQGYVENTEYRVSYIVIAGLLERLRNGRSASDLSDERILSAFFFLQSGRFDEHSGVKTEALKTCIHQELVQRKLLDKGLRWFYEPQLSADVEHVSNLHELLHEEACAAVNTALAQEWLQRFPDLRSSTEIQLIDHLIRMRALDALRTIAQQRPHPDSDNEKHLTWEAIRLLTDFEATSSRLENLAIDANLLWQLQERSQKHRYVQHGEALIWSTTQCAWVFQRFRALWPAARHPAGVSCGSHNAWDATEFLHSIAQQLANITTPDAIASLQALRDAPKDGYTEALQSLCHQQLRKSCEQNYVPASLDAVQSVANDAAPQSIEDLQAWVLEELGVVQTKIRASDVDSWRGFYDDQNTPYGEERCRDHLLELLRQGAREVRYDPEAHVADDKEVDITCSVGALRLPIEIKGQWHREVWTAADTQLVRQYTTDWQAHEHGIYLVLWFGTQQDTKKLKSLGMGQPVPTTAEEMQSMLTTRSVAAQSGKVKVVVLDIQHPAVTPQALPTTAPQAQAMN
ncbi:MAG: hypothetical protein ITG01_05010 [Comamonas sp.]|nr:hypothetical protein [Comamonas sp.]